MSDIQLGNMFWREVVADRDKVIEELKARIIDLESQIGIVLEIMFDSQIAEYQHLFESKVNISDSDSVKQTEERDKMSDQEEIETKRFARRSIEVKGLVHYDEGLPENAIHALSEYGVHWNLHGNVRLETTQLTRKTIYVAGDELPSGLTSKEKQWVLDLAEKNGLDVGVVEEEVEVLPDVPYIKAPILIITHAKTNG